MLYVSRGARTFGTKESNYSGVAPTNANLGTSLLADTGGKAAWTQMIAATTYDVWGFWINVHNIASSGACRTVALDIGIDPAGGTSYQVLIADWLIGGEAQTMNTGATTSAQQTSHFFPLFIPAGSSIAGRGYGNISLTAMKTMIQLFEHPVDPSIMKVGSYAEGIGVTSGYQGTLITMGTSSEGAWTSLGTTSKDFWWWRLNYQKPPADSVWIQGLQAFDVAVGDGSSYDIFIKNAVYSITGSEGAFINSMFHGYERFVPSGSTIYVRGQQSHATSDDPEMSLIAVGG